MVQDHHANNKKENDEKRNKRSGSAGKSVPLSGCGRISLSESEVSFSFPLADFELRRVS
ncbi:MAG: hypothetical protein NVSMB49_18000 [Ktedonobacteraceae bacterium]